MEPRVGVKTNQFYAERTGYQITGSIYGNVFVSLRTPSLLLLQRKTFVAVRTVKCERIPYFQISLQTSLFKVIKAYYNISLLW